MTNEEGDIVYLNKATGETAHTKPDDEPMEESKEEWRWIRDQQEAWIPAKIVSAGEPTQCETMDGLAFSIS